MVHLLFGELPVRYDFLMLDLLLLRDSDHFIGEVFESYAAISVFVESIEKMDDVSVKRIDSMQSQNFFELLQGNEIVIFSQIVSVDHFKRLVEVKVW